MPSTLKRIGKEAFAFCKSLEMLAIPEDVAVDERAFVGTKMVQAAAAEGRNPEGALVDEQVFVGAVNVSQEKILP